MGITDQENRSVLDEYDQATIGGDGRRIKAEALALFEYGWWTEGSKDVYRQSSGLNAERLGNGIAGHAGVRIDVWDAAGNRVLYVTERYEGRAWWLLRLALLRRRYGSNWREVATHALVER
jgi:hypothetical protein